jgi:hypothetical protein
MNDTGNPIADAVLVFQRHDVKNVLIGGSAAILHGASCVTQDVDFCCEWNDANLANLARALTAVNAKLRVQGLAEGLPVTFNAKYLRQYDSIALDTDIGFLDVRKSVDGIGDFEAVFRLSQQQQFGEYQIRVLSLDGLIQSKSYMARPRDLLILPELQMMREARDVEAGKDLTKDHEQPRHDSERGR